MAAVLAFERAHCIGKIARERVAVLPVQRIGRCVATCLRTLLNGPAIGWLVNRPQCAANTPPICRRSGAQQQLERLREQILHGSADGLVV